MIFFHFCETYKNQTRDLFDAPIRKTLNELEVYSSLKGIGKVTSFRERVFVLKLKSPFVEVILEEKDVQVKNKHYLVYFVRGIKTTLQEYVEIRDGKWLRYHPLEEKEINAFKQKQNKKDNPENTATSPPEEMIRWQYDYHLKVEYDVFENEEWVSFAMNNSSENGIRPQDLALYHVTLEKILSKQIEKNVHLSNDNWQLCYSSDNDIAILYAHIYLDNRSFTVLFNGANLKTQGKHWQNVLSEKRDHYKLSNYQDICSISSKAYPNWAIKDRDLWMKIEKNNELGNLSLLPEQTEFLDKFRFPKYINGQAGSGKSTMLYYLFANVYYYKYAGDIKGNIIFLTENEKLLDHTRNSVLDLLINNPQFELSSDDVAITNVSKHFHPFNEFLINLLPNDHTFTKDKFLNFSKFKNLYLNSRLPTHVINNYSAELVWFTISTYVYGRSTDYKITIDNYDDKMPKQGKELVPKDWFEQIESKIIIPFYDKLLNEEQYWDRAKLIRHIKSTSIHIEKYEVIFCDEAQDFSKIELEFIMRLSSYSNYDLANVEQFPLVFAGDALQTVNPTGFRSEVLTSMIFDELTNTGYDLQSSLEFTPKYNYRSSKAIVNIANAIQWHRKQEFSAKIISPQLSKRPMIYNHENVNVFIDFELFKNDHGIREKVEFKTIIVPVNNDEISSFKEKYPVLKNYDNILSAVDAKGIDFTEVVVFGFGDYILSLNTASSYEKSFLFNKLYVAVTRAQSELVIIDSQKSKVNFWQKIINNYILSEWSKELIDQTVESLQDVLIFDSNTIVQSKANIVESDADRQLEQGMIEESIPLLQVASSHFIKLGKFDKYYQCEGKIQEIKQNWKKAATLYSRKEVGREGLIYAQIVYWKGKLVSDLVQLGELNENPMSNIRFILSNLVLRKEISLTQSKLLTRNPEKCLDVLSEIDWTKDIINELFQLIIKNEDYDVTDNITELIVDIGDKNDMTQLCEILFEKKKFKRVCTIYEDKNLEDSKIYLASKLELATRRDDFEEIAIYSGRIAIEYEDHTDSILKNLISLYMESDKTDFNNPYVNLYTFSAFLHFDSTSRHALELSKKVESQFQELNREAELAGEYYNLIRNTSLSRQIKEFLIIRWAKNCYVAGYSIDQINKKYKKISKRVNQQYVAFQKSELSNISSIPDEIYPETLNNIQSVTLRNFRQFKHLEVTNLSLVNIVVGDNNIGKTSLLEGFLLATDTKNFVETLSVSYIERANLIPEKIETSDKTDWVYTLHSDFYFDYFNKDGDEKITCLVSSDRKSYEWYLKKGYHSVDDKNYTRFSNKDFNKINLSQLSKVPLIPYGKGFSHELAFLYDQLIRPSRNKEKAFVENLRIFIPKIERVSINVQEEIEIKEIDKDLDQPLHRFGEGANKLFRILLMLTIHRGKRLFIDEIDAGIHHSRFLDFWRVIITTCIRDNTQLVVTTHNEECISFFNDILNEDTNFAPYGRVVVLKNIDGLFSTTYEHQDFNLAIEDGVELRGSKTES